MAINSNLILGTEISKPTGTGFQDVLSELNAIKAALDAIKRTGQVDININLSGNAAQQASQIANTIQKNLSGIGGAAAAGGKPGINIPMNIDTGNLSKVQGTLAGISDQTKQAAAEATKYRQEMASLGGPLTKATVETRTISGNMEVVSRTTARAATQAEIQAGHVGDVVTTTQRLVNLDQQRLNSQQKQAAKQAEINQLFQRSIQDLQSKGFARSFKEGDDNLLIFRRNLGNAVEQIAKLSRASGKPVFSFRDNKQEQGILEFNKAVKDLESKGFARQLQEGNSNLVTFRRNLSETVDHIAKVNTETGKVTHSFRENRDRVAEVNRELQKQVGAAESIQQRNRLLADGFREVNQSVKETTRGMQRIVEFQRVRATPLDILRGTPEVDIARLNQVTGELTTTTLQGARAARLLGDGFLSAAGKVLLWTATTGAVFGVIGLLKEAVVQTLALEEGTILLARVGKGFENSMKGTEKEMENQIRVASELTQQLIELSVFYGVSATEAQQAAAIFARGGLTTKQTLEATRAAIIASRVAELGISESAKFLQAELAQFKLSADQLLPSLDRLNTLSNSYRVTTNDLLASISRAGSVFAEQGRTETELAAITAVLAQTTARSGSEIGTALRTIASNLERVDVATKLVEATGVAFQDAEGPTGGFAKTLAILQIELDKLNRSERNNIVIQAAGVRQRNIFEAALRGSTDALIAQIRAFEETGSATNEFKLQSATARAAIDRLVAAFTQLSQSASVNSTLKIIADGIATLTEIATAFSNVFGGTTIKILAVVAAFIAVRGVLVFVLPLLKSVAVAMLGINLSSVNAAIGIGRFFAIVNGKNVLLGGLRGALSAVNLQMLALTAATVLLAAASSATAQKQREEQTLSNEIDRDKANNAAEAIKSQRDLLEIAELEVQTLRETEAQLKALGAARLQSVPTRDTINSGGDDRAQIQEARILQLRTQSLIESLNKKAEAQNVVTTSVKNLQQAEEALLELQSRRKKSEDVNITTIKEQIANNQKNKKSYEEQIEVIRDVIKLFEEGVRKFQAGVTTEIFDSGTVEFQQLIERLNKANLPSLFDSGFAGIRDIKEFKDLLITIQAELEKTRNNTSDLNKKLFDLDGTSKQIQLQRILREAGNEARRTGLEIDAITDSISRISSISDALRLDKAIARQEQLNDLIREDLALMERVNQLIDVGQHDSPIAKNIIDRLEKLRKVELDLRVEKARAQIEALSKFFKQQFDDAFSLGKNITERGVTAERRFFELGEELDELHKLGALAVQTKSVFDSIFKQASTDAKLLNFELGKFADSQNLAAIAVLQKELSKAGLDSTRPDLGTSTTHRRLLEGRLNTIVTGPGGKGPTTRPISPDKARRIKEEADRAASEVQLSEAGTFILAKTQTEREQAAERLNELADIQIRIAEELVAKNREITAEMKQQTKEQIKQLGLLNEEDKLRVLAQAAFFAKNPSAKISATQQFLAGAETNRIGQEFFGSRLAKEFDVEKEPLGRLFAAAGFGNERTRQLRDSQKAIERERARFSGIGPGASDADIISKAVQQAQEFREQAIKIQESILRDFFNKLGDDVNKAVLGALGPSISEATGVQLQGPAGLLPRNFEVTFKPQVDINEFQQAIETTINAGFIRLRNQLLEFARTGLRIDAERLQRNQERVPPPIGAPRKAIESPYIIGETQLPDPGEQGPVIERQRVPQRPPRQISSRRPGVTINPTVRQIIRDYLGFQSGGTVPGSGRGDTQPVMAEPGEWFIRNPMARKYHDLLMAINQDRLRGYEDGGEVGSGIEGLRNSGNFLIKGKGGQFFRTDVLSGGGNFLFSPRALGSSPDIGNALLNYVELTDFTKASGAELIQQNPQFAGKKIYNVALRLEPNLQGHSIAELLQLRAMQEVEQLHGKGNVIFWSPSTSPAGRLVMQGLEERGLIKVDKIPFRFGREGVVNAHTTYTRAITPEGYKFLSQEGFPTLSPRNLPPPEFLGLRPDQGPGTAAYAAKLEAYRFRSIGSGPRNFEPGVKGFSSGIGVPRIAGAGARAEAILGGVGRAGQYVAGAQLGYAIGREAYYSTFDPKFLDNEREQKRFEELIEQYYYFSKGENVPNASILHDDNVSHNFKYRSKEEQEKILANIKGWIDYYQAKANARHKERMDYLLSPEQVKNREASLQQQRSFEELRRKGISQPRFENPGLRRNNQTFPDAWRRQQGGTIGGSGRGDTQHVMAEPGEFFIRNPMAQKYYDLLCAINEDRVPGYQDGGPVDFGNDYRGPNPLGRAGRRIFTGPSGRPFAAQEFQGKSPDRVHGPALPQDMIDRKRYIEGSFGPGIVVVDPITGRKYLINPRSGRPFAAEEHGQPYDIVPYLPNGDVNPLILKQIRELEDYIRGGRLVPRVDFGLFGSNSDYDNYSDSPSDRPGFTERAAPGGRFERRVDFALEEALSRTRSPIIGRSNAGRALRGPASAGTALRAPSSTAIPSAATLAEVRRRRSLPLVLPRNIGTTFPDVLPRAIDAPIGTADVRAAEAFHPLEIIRRAGERRRTSDIIKERIRNSTAGKVALANGQYADPIDLQVSKDRIAAITGGKVPLPNGQYADPSALQDTQARIGALNLRDASNATRTSQIIDVIKAANAGLAGVHTGNVGAGATISPSSPLGRVHQAIKDQTNLQRDQRKAQFEEDKRQRREGFLNRGEAFVERSLARRGLGFVGGENTDIRGAIPGVPANLGLRPELPDFSRRLQLTKPGGEPDMGGGGGEWHKRQRGTGQPRDYLYERRQGTEYNSGKLGFGSVMHPEIEWGPSMAKFEDLLAQAVINAFARAAPILGQNLAQQIHKAMANIPAKPASYRALT